jgi:hypothetical protein
VSPNYDVLDRNLATLLTRAYVAVHARESFRAQLGRDFAARASRLARPERARVFERPFVRIAAAAAVLLGVFVGGVWYAQRARPGATLDEILARGEVAMRRERGGAWLALQGGADAAPIRFEPRDPSGAFLEVHTPRSEPASVEMASIAAENSAVWQLAPASGLALDSNAATALNAQLDAGGVVARGSDAAPAWRVVTTEGELQLERGEVRVAYEAPEDPSAWEPRRDVSRAWVHVSVHDGRAHATRAGQSAALEANTEAYMSGGETLFAIAATELTPGGDRTSVDTAPPETGEPAAPAVDALFTGTAVRASDGTPLDEFRIVLLPLIHLPQVGQPSVQEFTAAHGRFEFPRSSLRDDGTAEAYRLEIQCAGLAPFRIERFTFDPTAPRSVAAVLDDGATARGIVVDASTGLPIADAYVVSENDTPVGVLALEAEENPALLVVSTRTASDGSFELKHLSAGPQLLRASAALHGPQWAEPLTLARGEVFSGIELRLAPEARIQGSILDSNAEPLAGLQVIASPNDFERQRPCLTFDWTESAADGTFELHGLGGGEWSVLKFSPRTQQRPTLAPEMAFAVLRPGAVSRVDFHARLPRQVLRGVVRDTAGNVVGGRNVMVAPIAKAGPPPDGEWSSALSAADGSYEIPDLEPGAYELFVSGRLPSEVVRVERFEVAAGRASTHDVVLPLGTIGGTVRNGDKHEPLDFAVLVLMRREENGDMNFVGKVFSDASGRYELPNLAAGVYTLYAYATSGELGQESFEPITLADGARVEHIDFELVRGASLDVHVVDGDGRPIDRATIELRDARGRDVQLAATQRTDSDGRFQPSGIKPGRLTVRASAEGCDGAEVAVDLVAGERAKVEITLKR